MGGKSKQSQRTKNNARPSSSGRSAELLNNAVNLESWNSPGGGKMTTLFPTLTSPIIDQDLSPEFYVCIKKLNKKDPITKTKALQELAELVNNSKVDDVAAALSSWAHFYKILAVDTDCKVREATQACHSAFARACGRRLAPALRQLVPAWLHAQHDDHAPAQTLAQASLKATFPENKLPEVISFCKAEVVAHFLDNLTGSVDKTILNRIESPEERELQYQRLVSASLQALRALAALLPDQHRAWLWDQLAPLFASAAYWKLANHASAQIRGAWFGALGSVIERFGAELEPAWCARASRVLLQHAHDQPSVAHQLWGCLLTLMYRVPDWHKWLDKMDLLTKRILDMLEKGGWGDARRLSEMLLPLLAHLPQDMLTKDFYEAFFNAFFKGLDKKNVLNSKSERQYWITSLAECLRYLSIQPHEFVAEVATAVHRTWLEKVLAEEHEPQLRLNLVKYSAASMASLVKYWLKQSKEANGEKYDQLVRNFWQNVASTVLLQIDSSLDADKVTPVIDGHILLLQTLKTAFFSEGKKPLSIKFDGDAPSEAVKVTPIQEIDPASVERYTHNLNEAVEKICCGYFEFADKKEIIEQVLTPLITILNEFDSKSLYLALAKHFGVDGVYQLYDRVLRRWMVTDTTRCKPVVDVTFTVLKHLGEEEQDAVMASFDQFPFGALEWCVSCSLSHVHCDQAGVRRWLRSDTVEQALLTLARRMLHQCCARARSLVFVCLSHDEMIIRTSTAMLIAQAVSQSLEERLLAPSSGALDLEHVAAVGAHLVTALVAVANHQAYQGLVLSLFQLIVLQPRGSLRLSNETWSEVRDGVHDGVLALRPPARAGLLARLAAALQRRLRTLEEEVEVPSLEHMVSLCPPLVLSDARAPSPEVREFCGRVLALEERGDVPVEMYALRYDCIVGNLNCPIDDDNDIIKRIVDEAEKADGSELTKPQFVLYANSLLFRAIFLRTLMLYDNNDELDDVLEEDDEDTSEVSQKNEENAEEKKSPKTPAKVYLCDEFLRDDYFLQEFCKVIHDYAVVTSLRKAYGFWHQHDMIQQTETKLAQVIQAITDSTSDEVRERILSRLVELSLTEGYYWAYAKVSFEVDILKASGEQPSLPVDLDEAKMEELLTGNGFFHTLQASVSRQTEGEARLQAQYAVMMRCMVLAWGGQAAGDVLAACRRRSLDPVVAFYHQHQQLVLYERSISSLSWQACVAEASVSRCAAALLAAHGWDAPAHHWDFATVGLCTSLDALRRPGAALACTKVNLILCAALSMYQFIERFVSGLPAQCERRQPQPHVAHLMSEWRDVFAPALNRDLYLIAIELLECGSRSISSGQARTLSALQQALQQADWRLVDAAHRAPDASLGLRRLTAACCAALARALHPAYHWLAYTLLMQLVTPLADYSEEQLRMWSEGGSEEGEARARPQLASDWFLAPLTRAADLAEAALDGHVVGESCEMQPGSDAYCVALGCLLLAEALHQLTLRARGDLQHHYTQAYRENKLSESLLPTALRLLPGALLALALQPHSSAPLPPRFAASFRAVPRLLADDAMVWKCIGAVACRGVAACVSGAGSGGARGWWGAAGRPARALSRLAAAYVTPGLVRRQLDQLLARRGELEDTEVTVVWSSSEACVVYRVEDRPVELRVRFEADFPLTPPRVAAPTARPAVNTSWIAMFIAYQNGTVLNAVKMWSAALSSKVESAPQCFVCYCRLHPATGHLPQVRCHQCRNRFHTACLHKWFVTSHKSNCPLCRSNF